MTEREKMAQIIAEHLCPQGKAHKTLYGAARRCYSRNNFAGCEKVSECVDALIKAGIGDVRVAERAFKEICIDKIFGEDDGLSIKWMWGFYKARAERKLAEEDKR